MDPDREVVNNWFGTGRRTRPWYQEKLRLWLKLQTHSGVRVQSIFTGITCVAHADTRRERKPLAMANLERQQKQGMERPAVSRPVTRRTDTKH